LTIYFRILLGQFGANRECLAMDHHVGYREIAQVKKAAEHVAVPIVRRHIWPAVRNSPKASNVLLSAHARAN
jgi:hypothetical protein